MSPSTSAPKSNLSRAEADIKALWNDEYAISEEPDVEQSQQNMGPSILSSEIRTTSCSRNARPLKGREIRREMIKKELGPQELREGNPIPPPLSRTIRTS
ncbi:hypothetical protein VTO42DRAFT_4272 [Malbranchea cinnamomea]